MQNNSVAIDKEGFPSIQSSMNPIHYKRCLMSLIGMLFLSVSAFAQQPAFLTNGLVAYYPFNGDSKDASGNGNDLTAVGNPSFASSDRFGNHGNAVNLNGNGDYLLLNKSIQDTAFVKAPVTISFWRKGKGWDSAVVVESSSTALWAVGGNLNDVIRCDENVGISGGHSDFEITTSFTESEWIHTVFVLNGSSSVGYTNGSVALRGTVPELGIPPNDSRLYIGADPYAGFEYWNGQFDEIRLYNRALSDLEVNALYQYESVPQKTDSRQATAIAQVVNGVVVGVTITDTGHGYEGVIPPVTFIGGGGTGAEGTAIVNNGIVIGINFSSNGSGYTNAPYVLIAAPPGLPSAEIEVNSVKITLHLIPGYTYKIQTTTDAGNTWTDVENGILAINETLVRTFNVISNTQWFRVVQVN